jgi:hypothetical protein
MSDPTLTTVPRSARDVDRRSLAWKRLIGIEITPRQQRYSAAIERTGRGWELHFVVHGRQESWAFWALPLWRYARAKAG